MERPLIATHNSATGEKPTWWSAPLTPFARTQSKTIFEQFLAGCTLFDIRVRKVFGTWRCAHGWWATQRSFEDIIEELDYIAGTTEVAVTITYEGRVKDADGFCKFIQNIKRLFPNLHYGPVCAKYGSAEPLLPADDGWCPHPSERAFLTLDGSTWHTLIPIPALWKRFFFTQVIFNNNVYKYVDFL